MKSVLFRVLIVLSLAVGLARASDMYEAVHRAVYILNEQQHSDHPIPQIVLKRAKGLGIIEVTKGGLGVAGSDGEGVIVNRLGDKWSAPFAFTQSGGSFGFQIGLDVKKLIYIFNTDKAWHAFTGSDRVKFQAAVVATAGPDWVANESDKSLPPSDVYVYTTSKGAFVGASIGGQSVGASDETNMEIYRQISADKIFRPEIESPACAKALYDLLDLISTGQLAPTPKEPPRFR